MELSPAVEIDGEAKQGFETPSKKLELFSTTIKDWGWPEYATPKWIPSHVHHQDMDMAGTGKATITDDGNGAWKLTRNDGIKKWKSSDDDTERIWWNDTGVHQNLTFAVQPDPISGMQCWHQRVHVTPAESGDQYGDVVVDTAKSREAYLEWLAKTRPGPGPNGLRRPLWYARPLKPQATAYLAE